MRDSDINLQIKPRNAHILRAMRRLGYATSAEFCRANNLFQTTFGEFLNMQKSPINKRNGDWKEYAKRLAALLLVECEDLWPEHMKEITAKKSSTEIEVPLSTAMLIASSADDPSVAMEKREMIEGLFGILTRRERAIISARMCGGTLEEVGIEQNITRERTRQIEQRAIKKMRSKALTRFGIRTPKDAYQ